ncbi:MAG: response regulator [bacterium]|nr:response regulator [bacterium]
MMNDNNASTILIVDDNPQNLKVLGNTLRENNYMPVVAQSGPQALIFARQGNPDLILLDIMMPDMDGYEVCQKLKKDKVTKDTPVIFLTAKTETEDLVRAFEVGGVDYITKPFNSIELLTRVKCQIDLKREIVESKMAREKLQQSEKLELVGILSGGIAHDFNNLLSVIIGNLAIAKEEFATPNRFVENAEKASNQAAELVKKFLIISEGGWMMKDKVTLPGIFTYIADTSDQVNDISYNYLFPDDLKPLYGAERQLRQVMENLLTNAHEATEHLGEDAGIAVSAENMTLTGDNQWALKEGEYVKVSVMDNGKGIPSHLLGKIFDPYFSTKERGTQKGMGMGLTLCHAIARKHGGQIGVSARIPNGTQVDVFLPVYLEKIEMKSNIPTKKTRERKL